MVTGSTPHIRVGCIGPTNRATIVGNEFDQRGGSVDFGASGDWRSNDAIDRVFTILRNLGGVSTRMAKIVGGGVDTLSHGHLLLIHDQLSAKLSPFSTVLFEVAFRSEVATNY